MCDPITLGALAVSAVGSGLSAAGQAQTAKKQEQARNEMARLELERQRGFQSEADQALQRALTGFTPTGNAQATDTASAKREAIVNAMLPQAQTFVKATPSAPNVVNTARGEYTSKETGKAGSQAVRAAKLAALGDVFFNNQIGINRSGSDIGNINSKAAGSYRLLPYEQEAAAASVGASPLSYLGLLMKAGGTIGGLAGMSGAFAAPVSTAGYNAGGMLAPDGLSPL